MSVNKRAENKKTAPRKSTSSEVERRVFYSGENAELRTVNGENESRVFEGYAAVFGRQTQIGPPKYGFLEQVAQGTFVRALREKQDVVSVFNHDLNYLLGRTSSGTLRLREDDHGLFAENDLPDTQLGRDLVVQVDRGDVAGMSFSFIVRGETWETLDDGTELRTITDVDLFDVSPCVSPAYTDTTAGIRMVDLASRNRPLAAQVDESEDELEDPDEIRAWTDGLYDRYMRAGDSIFND